MAETDFDRAERLTARRARMATVLGIVFIATQTASLETDAALSRPELIGSWAWLLWSLSFIMLLATGGGLIRSAQVRALMNDETTRANRLHAIASGFWIALATALVAYIVSFYEPLDARQVVRVIITTALGGAMIRFGALERKSLAG